MKTLYIDCGMGAAGDMLTGALFELYPDKDGFLKEINAALDGRAELSAAPDKKCGISGTHITVTVEGDVEGQEHTHTHRHTSIARLRELIGEMPLSEKVRTDALAVFELLAQAEAAVHGQTMENVHFHEVGSHDAVADILSVCLLMEKLAPEEILASPINVGSGTVKCAHGILPVPAPATERLLRGIPYYSGDIRTELCTPTGAALLRYFVKDFCEMPTMCVTACGYGTGTKDLPQFNALRAVLGERRETERELLELSCNLDDMTGEEIGFALEQLFRAGALDAWTAPIGMKKSRPGILLSCLCRPEKREDLMACFFKHTTTLGVREKRCSRRELGREFRTASGPLGEIRVKHAEGAGVSREKAEYEELANFARDHDLSLREIKETLMLR